MKEHIRSFHMKYSSLLPTHRLQNYGSYKALYVFALVHTSPSSHIIKLNRNDNSQTQLCISTYVAAARQMWNTQMLDRSLVDPARLNSIKSTPLPLRKLIGAEQIALSYNKSGALLIKWYLREGAMIKQSYNETNRWFKDQSPLVSYDGGWRHGRAPLQ